MDDDSPAEPELIRVMALHALAYCERLFYFEEVEEIRRADARVYRGRALHEQLEKAEGERGERVSLDLSSSRLGLVGRVDCLKRRDGRLVPYEHKRGRANRGRTGSPAAWPSDELQVAAYAVLLEEHTSKPVRQGFVRYHHDEVTVRVRVGPQARKAVETAVLRARALRRQQDRPPVTDNPYRCRACSLAPICLPEEERSDGEREVERLFPEIEDRRTLHVITAGATVHRKGRTLEIREPGGDRHRYPLADISSVVLHGYCQITTQAIHACVRSGIALHWMTSSGQNIGGLAGGTGTNHRRIRQYEALRSAETRLGLAWRLAAAKVHSQRAYLQRATRGAKRTRAQQTSINEIGHLLDRIERTDDIEVLRGLEGAAARLYFARLPDLLRAEVEEGMRPQGRSRRPPRDRFNAVLSFGYALLYRQVLQAVLAVGLEPAFGFFHAPRSAAAPLVLDLIELFRVPVWDMTVVGSVNRLQWHLTEDFDSREGGVYLTSSGRRKAIALFEARLLDTWKHPELGYSLSYGRTLELEARLLEKEWSGRPGLFATGRLR
jgi:CRISPR-associated protein Cas1